MNKVQNILSVFLSLRKGCLIQSQACQFFTHFLLFRLLQRCGCGGALGTRSPSMDNCGGRRIATPPSRTSSGPSRLRMVVHLGVWGLDPDPGPDLEGGSFRLPVGSRLFGFRTCFCVYHLCPPCLFELRLRQLQGVCLC